MIKIEITKIIYKTQNTESSKRYTYIALLVISLLHIKVIQLVVRTTSILCK